MDSLQQALSQLINFYDSPMGLALYRAEKRMLETYITNIFGYHLLQIGGPEDLSWLKSSPIRNHHRFSDCINNVDVASACYGKLDMLPFVSEGIDLIFLPHTLNLLQDTTAVLTEVKRCLATEGRLIIINFVQLI